MNKPAINNHDLLASLKAFTAARIALGRVGNSIPLNQSLQLKLAHAHARDAIYSEFNVDGLIEGLQHHDLPIFRVHSNAESREQYLQRPDMGRQLHEASAQTLYVHAAPCDICIIVADGLSAHAVNTNAIPLINALMILFKGLKYSLSPLILASQSRVALADPVAYALQAKLSIILIGERPGLSSADSVGAYLTYNPKPGLTDESRNCVSNIRPAGLSFDIAAQKIFYLVQEAFKRRLSGVNLKDNAGLLNG
ncbi:ethanolamine ammonia-lyase subunit EutC [Mucilaginibacter terrae]|uniref:ethanolamine ammonia-lyase subunit EutC n=1 Tax=Mucilaginibacter terrae TaxID=1955052 RepID=UPI003626AF53